MNRTSQIPAQPEPVEAHELRAGNVILHRSNRRPVVGVTVVVELDEGAELILMPTSPVLRVEDLNVEERATVDEISALVADAERSSVPSPRQS